MKIAKYKGRFYLYVSNKAVCNLVTNHGEKATAGFIYEDGMYFKNVHENDVSEIFEVHFWVKYDVGIPGLPDEWEVGNGPQDVKGDHILIRFSNGILPGWHTEERNVCVKYVDKNDIPFGKIEKKYYRRNDITINPPERVDEKTDIDNLIHMQIEYRNNNL